MDDMNKRTVTTTAIMATLLALAALAVSMLHAQANQGQQQAIWRQAVITVDDQATVDAAQGWDAPMRVAYAPKDADIHVERILPGGRVAGEAQWETDGDTIVGCKIAVQAETETRAVLAHEVGHCLGLWSHAMNPASLMHAETGRPGVSAGDVTPADRRALALLYTDR